MGWSDRQYQMVYLDPDSTIPRVAVKTISTFRTDLECQELWVGRRPTSGPIDRLLFLICFVSRGYLGG